MPIHALLNKNSCLRKAMALMLWLFLCLCTSQAHAIKIIHVTESSLANVQEKVNALKKALGDTEAEKKAATAALKANETAISQSNKRLFELEKETRQNNQKQASLTVAFEDVQQQLAHQKSALSKQLYHQYTLGQQDYLSLMLQNKTPGERSRDLAYFGYLSKAQSQNIQQLQHNLAQLKTLNEDIAKAIKEAKQLQAEQLAHQDALKQQKKHKAEIVALLSNKANKQRSALEKLKQDEQNLTSLMVKLERQAAKKKKKAAKKDKVIATNQYEPDSSTNGRKFRKLKGKLRLPVKGKLINRYGQQRTETGITWKGLFIKANSGARVKSVASGKVVFANWMRGFGNLIIVDHGEGYMSLYGNNESLFKSVGDKVKGGDIISAVGNSGGNENTGLYYELRKKSKPFDPLRWSRLK